MSWTEIDWVEFLMKALRDSIGIKVKAYTPILLSEARRLATNFEKQDRGVESSWLEKRPIGSNPKVDFLHPLNSLESIVITEKIARLSSWAIKNKSYTAKKTFVSCAMNLDKRSLKCLKRTKRQTTTLEVEESIEALEHDGGGLV